MTGDQKYGGPEETYEDGPSHQRKTILIKTMLTNGKAQFIFFHF